MSAVRKPESFEPPMGPDIQITGYITDPQRTGYTFTIDGVPYEIDMPAKIDKSDSLSPAQQILFDLRRSASRHGVLSILLADKKVRKI